jgi:hypothetical protein
MYNKKTNKRLRKKSRKTKRFRTKSNKMRRNTIKRYRKNKKGGIYGVRPPPSGAIHHGTEIPHYHFNVLLPDGRTITLETSFGITHTLDKTRDTIYSDYVANVLQSIQDKTRDSNLTLFWKGKMLLPSMKLRRINVDGHFIDLNELSGDMNLTSKYTNQLTREDFENIADEYSPEEGSTEYHDKPDTPREQKGEQISSYDDQIITKFNEKIEERKRQLSI